MEQKDYLQREIEKIGVVLRAILNWLKGKAINEAITIEKRFEETKEKLFTEINFDVGGFIQMNDEESRIYLSNFKGFDHQNIELLADIIYDLGLNQNLNFQKVYLVKALQLYELCSVIDKTFSVDREAKIESIRSKI